VISQMNDRGAPPTDVEPVALTFPDLPRLELDQLLTQLVERAGGVMAAQGRLRGLLRANQTIIGDMTLPTVLRRIVEAARELVGARYAALGVLAPDTGLAEFIHLGMSGAAVAEIGHLPQGKGLLGAVIDDARPIRLHDLTRDSRSSGFPTGHPPMGSFLGVPIRIRDEVFGNLYLAESGRGRFSTEDEELTRALAATAAVAIDNARHYEVARRRGEWLAATADITRRMLAARTERPLRLVAERSRELADADLVAVLLPDADSRDELRVEVAVGGPGAEDAAARLTGHRVPVATSISGHVFTEGEPLRVTDPRRWPDRDPTDGGDGGSGIGAGLDTDLDTGLDTGPVLLVPLMGSQGTNGVLTVARSAGRPSFSTEDLDMAVGFAGQAWVALELAEARAEQERAGMLDERERIAADLHDHVIQRLFGSGLSLQGVAARLAPGPGRDRVLGVIGDLDDTIAQIRTRIFALRQDAGDGDNGLRAQILDVITEVAPGLGFTPVLRFTGPIDTLLPPGGDRGGAVLIDDLVAVLREALSNVARHARAARVEVDLVAGGPGAESVTRSARPDGRADRTTVTLRVTDDGVGVGQTARRSGLANLRRRAERHGGTLTLAPRRPRGTCLTWAVPIS
jgi:GAF domain-containing protein